MFYFVNVKLSLSTSCSSQQVLTPPGPPFSQVPPPRIFLTLFFPNCLRICSHVSPQSDEGSRRTVICVQTVGTQCVLLHGLSKWGTSSWGGVTSPIYLLEYKLALNPLSYATAGLGLSQHFENPNEITENITFPTNLKFE